MQAYTVVARRDGYEVRDYPACTVVDTEVAGRSFRDAGNAGFRPLLRYISGGNSARRQFAMTAPVVQQPGQGSHTVTFVLPAGARDVPSADDSRVTVRECPQQFVAVRRYSGSTGEEHFTQELEQLRAALARDGLVEAGTPRLARYDPPWTPWFLRRNEAQVPVVWP